jgi:hypothetical protein
MSLPREEWTLDLLEKDPPTRDRMPLGARGNALTANPTTSDIGQSSSSFQVGIGGVMTKQEQADNKLEWQQLAQPGTLVERALTNSDLTPGERLLAVTLLGLPVSKEAA